MDYLRSSVLRRALKFSTLRRVYSDRTKRITLQFVVGTLLTSLLVLAFPVIAFYLGPLLLGIPHLLASLRFSNQNRTTSSALVPKLLKLTLAVLLLESLGLALHLETQFLPELLAVCGTVWIVSGKWELTALVGILLGVSQNRFPLGFALILLIGHNFVAFIFWFKACSNSAQRASVLKCLIILLTVSVLVILAPTNSEKLSRLLFTGLESEFLKSAVLKLFLLSQAAHYFIWLKAIPEYQSSAETPAPFSTTFKNIKSELGPNSVSICLILLLAILSITLASDFEEARQFYILISSFHGLCEIGILLASLTSSNSTTTELLKQHR